MNGTHYTIKRILRLDFHHTQGKPNSLKPAARPAPWRTLPPMEGATKSRMENMAAAVTPRRTILSMDSGFSGRMEATMPTTKPSTKYLTRRVNISWTLKLYSIVLCYNFT